MSILSTFLEHLLRSYSFAKKVKLLLEKSFASTFVQKSVHLMLIKMTPRLFDLMLFKTSFAYV